MAFACTIPAVPTVQQDDATLRITRWDFAPGAVTGWHAHGWPYFVVMLMAGTLQVHDGDRVTETVLTAGQAYHRPAGIRHDVMNGSDHPIAFVEIEVKQPGALVTLCRRRLGRPNRSRGNGSITSDRAAGRSGRGSRSG